MSEALSVYNGQDTDRVIKGVILKQVDGRNSVGGEEVSKDKQYIVIGTAKAQSFWGGQVQSILQKPSEPLINIEELNSKIPQKEWELGFDGKPRAPWALNFVVYLLDPETGSVYTTINSTYGMHLAVESLCEKAHYMRSLRGPTVVPIVKFGSVTMKTKFGTKQRPDFKVVEWRDMSGSNEPKMLGKPAAEPTTTELVGETID